MYVDDVIGVCFEEDLPTDLQRTRDICTNLLGSGAVADDKTESGRRIDVIGYTVDLDTERVLIARKNFLSALHGFMSTGLDSKMNLRSAQRLASWGTRYGKICRVMRPFCGALNRMTLGRTDGHALFLLSQEARIAVQCWRAMLCLVRHRETEFTRAISSFAPKTPIITAEFDASLSGAGLIWYVRTGGTEVARGVGAVSLLFLGFGDDSSYQNLAEFIGAILAVIGQVALGHAGSSLALRGDSVTALTWAITERPRGTIVTNAAMVWTLLCVSADVDVREVTHIAGEDNDKCDRLSRRGAQPPRSLENEVADMAIGEPEIVDLMAIPGVRTILELCDPRRVFKSEAEFFQFWNEAREATKVLLSGFTEFSPITPPSTRGSRY